MEQTGEEIDAHELASKGFKRFVSDWVNAHHAVNEHGITVGRSGGNRTVLAHDDPLESGDKRVERAVHHLLDVSRGDVEPDIDRLEEMIHVAQVVRGVRGLADNRVDPTRDPASVFISQLAERVK